MVSMSSIRQLLMPALFSIQSQLARPEEEADLWIDPQTDSLKAHVAVFGNVAASIEVCSRREIEDGSFKHHFRSRIFTLFHRARERFVVRRLVLADIEKPTLSERHQHVATRSIKRGKFKQANSNHLPVVRIPRLLSVSPISQGFR